MTSNQYRNISTTTCGAVDVSLVAPVGKMMHVAGYVKATQAGAEAPGCVVMNIVGNNGRFTSKSVPAAAATAALADAFGPNSSFAKKKSYAVVNETRELQAVTIKGMQNMVPLKAYFQEDVGKLAEHNVQGLVHVMCPNPKYKHVVKSSNATTETMPYTDITGKQLTEHLITTYNASVWTAVEAAPDATRLVCSFMSTHWFDVKDKAQRIIVKAALTGVRDAIRAGLAGKISKIEFFSQQAGWDATFKTVWAAVWKAADAAGGDEARSAAQALIQLNPAPDCEPEGAAEEPPAAGSVDMVAQLLLQQQPKEAEEAPAAGSADMVAQLLQQVKEPKEAPAAGSVDMMVAQLLQQQQQAEAAKLAKPKQDPANVAKSMNNAAVAVVKIQQRVVRERQEALNKRRSDAKTDAEMARKSLDRTAAASTKKRGWAQVEAAGAAGDLAGTAGRGWGKPAGDLAGADETTKKARVEEKAAAKSDDDDVVFVKEESAQDIRDACRARAMAALGFV